MGCDVYSELLATAEVDLVLSSASQLLIPKFDISCSGEVRAAATVFKDESGCTFDF